jgi:hypothetical protein
MTSESKTWESLKTEYLHQVEKALSSIKHPRKKEVLEDVCSHLDRRFAELKSDEQTWENFQAIITEMGPASDYAELLEPEAIPVSRGASRKYLLYAGLAAFVIITFVILLPMMISRKVQIIASEQGRIEDKIDYPFVNDPQVIGAWKSVDFVKKDNDFKPGRKNWKGELFLNHLVFEEGGDIAGGLYTWTKGLVLNEHSKTASIYEIKEIDGATYLFFQWKSGDYTIRHQTPNYYVLKKVSLESVKSEPMLGKKADIPSTSTIYENGRIVDKIDYPFVNDPEALGAWQSVDFVENIEDFEPGTKSFKGDLFLKELFILENGRTNWAFTWTKGLILHAVDKTASKYLIKDIDGTKYMFFEWKSGDYVFRHMKPSYYVLKKAPDKPYVESRTVDKIDYPFIDDPEVVATWKSVDFVDTVEQFNPDRRHWKGSELFLKELVFLSGGKTTNSWRTWTIGLVLDSNNKTASRYIIKEINGSTYMFFEWKSGDYTIRGMKPKYYVLKKD